MNFFLLNFTFPRAAADQGHPHAQYNLAAAHLNGHDAGLDEVRFFFLKLRKEEKRKTGFSSSLQ